MIKMSIAAIQDVLDQIMNNMFEIINLGFKENIINCDENSRDVLYREIERCFQSIIGFDLIAYTDYDTVNEISNYLQKKIKRYVENINIPQKEAQKEINFNDNERINEAIESIKKRIHINGVEMIVENTPHDNEKRILTEKALDVYEEPSEADEKATMFYLNVLRIINLKTNMNSTYKYLKNEIKSQPNPMINSNNIIKLGKDSSNRFKHLRSMIPVIETLGIKEIYSGKHLEKLNLMNRYIKSKDKETFFDIFTIIQPSLLNFMDKVKNYDKNYMIEQIYLLNKSIREMMKNITFFETEILNGYTENVILENACDMMIRDTEYIHVDNRFYNAFADYYFLLINGLISFQNYNKLNNIFTRYEIDTGEFKQYIQQHSVQQITDVDYRYVINVLFSFNFAMDVYKSFDREASKLLFYFYSIYSELYNAITLLYTSNELVHIIDIVNIIAFEMSIFIKNDTNTPISNEISKTFFNDEVKKDNFVVNDINKSEFGIIQVSEQKINNFNIYCSDIDNVWKRNREQIKSYEDIRNIYDSFYNKIEPLITSQNESLKKRLSINKLYDEFTASIPTIFSNNEIEYNYLYTKLNNANIDAYDYIKKDELDLFLHFIIRYIFKCSYMETGQVLTPLVKFDSNGNLKFYSYNEIKDNLNRYIDNIECDKSEYFPIIIHIKETYEVLLHYLVRCQNSALSYISILEKASNGITEQQVVEQITQHLNRFTTYWNTFENLYQNRSIDMQYIESLNKDTYEDALMSCLFLKARLNTTTNKSEILNEINKGLKILKYNFSPEALSYVISLSYVEDFLNGNNKEVETVIELQNKLNNKIHDLNIVFNCSIEDVEEIDFHVINTFSDKMIEKIQNDSLNLRNYNESWMIRLICNKMESMVTMMKKLENRMKVNVISKEINPLCSYLISMNEETLAIKSINECITDIQSSLLNNGMYLEKPYIEILFRILYNQKEFILNKNDFVIDYIIPSLDDDSFMLIIPDKGCQTNRKLILSTIAVKAARYETNNHLSYEIMYLLSIQYDFVDQFQSALYEELYTEYGKYFMGLSYNKFYKYYFNERILEPHVENKLNVRAGGSKDMVTGQPTKGKKHGGGQSFDRMAFDANVASGICELMRDTHLNKDINSINDTGIWTNLYTKDNKETVLADINTILKNRIKPNFDQIITDLKNNKKSCKTCKKCLKYYIKRLKFTINRLIAKYTETANNAKLKNIDEYAKKNANGMTSDKIMNVMKIMTSDKLMCYDKKELDEKLKRIDEEKPKKFQTNQHHFEPIHEVNEMSSKSGLISCINSILYIIRKEPSAIEQTNKRNVFNMNDATEILRNIILSTQELSKRFSENVLYIGYKDVLTNSSNTDLSLNDYRILLSNDVFTLRRAESMKDNESLVIDWVTWINRLDIKDLNDPKEVLKKLRFQNIFSSEQNTYIPTFINSYVLYQIFKAFLKNSKINIICKLFDESEYECFAEFIELFQQTSGEYDLDIPESYDEFCRIYNSSDIENKVVTELSSKSQVIVDNLKQKNNKSTQKDVIKYLYEQYRDVFIDQSYVMSFEKSELRCYVYNDPSDCYKSFKVYIEDKRVGKYYTVDDEGNCKNIFGNEFKNYINDTYVAKSLIGPIFYI